MGIPNLQSYMERNPSIYYKIDIENAIRRVPVNRRIIVLDGSSCQCTFYGKDPLCMVSGGQYQEFRENVRQFIKYFQNKDTKLVAFFDGTVMPKKMPVWIERRYQTYDKVHKILDALDGNKKIYSNDNVIPPALQSVAISEFYEHCELHLSTDKECDDEILEYANKHNCLAIISCDSDFAVSQGTWSYWSVKDINLHEGSVYVYDKKALAHHFNLHERQLPLLATLMGNDFISKDMLKSWHDKLMWTAYNAFVHRNDLFPVVASYVQDCGPNLSDTVLKKISNDVFKTPDMINLIRQTLDSYLGESIMTVTPLNIGYGVRWEAILARALELKNLCKVSMTLDCAITYHCCHLTSNYEDFRRDDLPSAGLFWRPLRIKVYNIAFTNYSGPPVRIEEWVSAGPWSLEKATFITPEPYNKYGLDLLDFWADEPSTNIMNVAWELFCTSINLQLTKEVISHLPTYIIPTCLTLLCMSKSCHLKHQDFVNFLNMSIICNINELAVHLINRSNIRRINTYALRLSTIFLRGIQTMKMLSQVCANVVPKECFSLANVFDGLVLQYFYNGGIIKDLVGHPDLTRSLKFIEDFKHLF